jgi:hypothetical protein
MKIFGVTFSLGKDDGEAAETDTSQAQSEPSLSIRMGAGGALDMPCKAGRFYVYRHRAPNGRVFYVGKGTGNRAWSKDRPPEHQQYVDRFCGGRYEVEVVRNGVSEDDALTLEDVLMQEHGATIINRQNLHAPYSSDRMQLYCGALQREAEALTRARSLRDVGYIDDAKQAFVEAYTQALLTREYSDYDQGARSLVDIPFPAPTAIAHEYTVMLFKAGAYSEVVDFVDKFERDYGPHFTVQAQQAVLKRRERARGMLQLRGAGPKSKRGRARG